MRKYNLRLIFLAALLAVSLLISGCHQSQEESAGEYQVYYLDRDETRVVSVPFHSEADDVSSMVKDLLTQLATPPEDGLEKAPLALGFSLLSYEIRDNQLFLQVNEKYRDLSPTTEILTRGALVLTLTQAEGIDFVSLQVGEEPLTDRLGNAVGAMSADMFLNNEGNEINSYDRTELTLFFADSTGTALVECTRRLTYSSNISMDKLVMEQLIAGPDADSELLPILPSDTKLLSVNIKDGVCYVNLDATFLNAAPYVTAEVTLYGIVNSLAELSNVNKVQICVNGETGLTFRDQFDLSAFYERNLELTLKQ